MDRNEHLDAVSSPDTNGLIGSYGRLILFCRVDAVMTLMTYRLQHYCFYSANSRIAAIDIHIFRQRCEAPSRQAKSGVNRRDRVFRNMRLAWYTQQPPGLYWQKC